MGDDDDRRFGQTTRRVGYGVTIVINLVILWIANNLLEWEWFPWLTEDFETVLPWVNASLIATMVSQVIYFLADAPPIKRLVDLVTTGISLVATIRMWNVFPFDFSAYSFDWGVLIRVILGLAIFGMTIGLIVDIVSVFRGPLTNAPDPDDDPS